MAWSALCARPLRRPVPALTGVFLAWKLVLLFLAAASPGPGYDTSSLIVLARHVEPGQRQAFFDALGVVDRLALRLFRWDALYFVGVADRGFAHEQEWAFSGVYAQLLSFVGQLLPSGRLGAVGSYIWAGVLISNLCHYLSALAASQLAARASKDTQFAPFPFLVGALHIISPGGLFLCAPYTEALFSVLNFSGMLLFVSSHTSKRSAATQHACTLGSGIMFATAALVRSNGLLSAALYLYDLAASLQSIFRSRAGAVQATSIAVNIVSGMVVLAGFAGPQWLAWSRYCAHGRHEADARPWCNERIPSIYSWVQATYWDVGFLRYWRLSNAPLFLLAAPTLWLLIASSGSVLTAHFQRQPEKPSRRPAELPRRHNKNGMQYCGFPQLALPQLILATTALTNFHVQIVNRLSSGYPIWYFMIAMRFAGQAASSGIEKQPSLQWIIRWMVMYAMIQGIAFATFLPPA